MKRLVNELLEVRYYSVGHLSTNLKGAVADIRGDRRLIEDANSYLRAGGFRADLQVGIAQTLADRVDTNEGSSAQEVLTLQ